MYGYDGEYQYPSGPGARERDRNAHTYRESDNENDHAYPSGPTGNGYRRNESDNPFDENSPTYASGLAEADAAFEAEFGRKPSPSPLYAQPGSGASRGAAPARLSGLGQGPGLGQGQGQGQEQRQRQSSGRMLPPRLDGAARGASGAPARTMGPLGGGTQGGVGSGSKNDPWGSGGWSGHTSPTSSRGTRGSAQMDENPFR